MRQQAEQALCSTLKWDMAGYKCDRQHVVSVLVKAAIERQTIKSICADLIVSVSSNTLHEQLNRLLDVCALYQQEWAMNAGLA